MRPRMPGVSRSALDTFAHNVGTDLVTAEVVRALREAGFPPILLKGPSVVRWLYDPRAPRRYGDTDLLVPPPLEVSEAVLRNLGFSRFTPGDHRFHRASVLWIRESDGRGVDLHQRFHGLEASADQVWDVLNARTEGMESPARTSASSMPPPARCSSPSTPPPTDPCGRAEPTTWPEPSIA